jgi:hypothetical protein
LAEFFIDLFTSPEVIFTVILLFTAPPAALFFSMKSVLGEGEPVLEINEPMGVKRYLENIERFLLFLRIQGVQQEGWFSFRGREMVSFIHDGSSLFTRRIIFYFNREKHSHFEIVSTFNRLESLTTASKLDFWVPRPEGEFFQCIKTTDIEKLWKVHMESEDQLLISHSIKFEKKSHRLKQQMEFEMARLHDHIKSIPLWPLRSIYWFYIKTPILSNKIFT